MNRLLTLFARAAGYLLALLPRRLSWLLGQSVGLLFYYLIPIRKGVARANLATAFPDWTPARRRRILRRTYRHYGVVLLDFLAIPAWVRRPEAIIRLDTSALDTARRDDPGLILLTGHLGNWEMTVLAMGAGGWPMMPVVVAQRGWAMSIVRQTRAATGCVSIPWKAPARQMLKHLRQGKYLGLAADQDARRKGVWVTFFGQPSSRFKGGATFHLSSGAPLLFMRCVLQGDHRYRIDFLPISTAGLSGDRPADAQLLTQRFMDLLETEVRLHPEQYFWFHRMWKTKPVA